MVARNRTNLKTGGAGEMEGDSLTQAAHFRRENLGLTPPSYATSAGVAGLGDTYSFGVGQGECIFKNKI